jgi:hypothetical protein
MPQAQTNTPRVGQVVRTLATCLWLPAIFVVGFLVFFVPAFHRPVPHHVTIAVAASPTATARLQHELDVAVPDGFTLWPTDGAAGARSAVLHLRAIAAYVPDGHHPLLYGAAADGPSVETIVRNTFAAAAERADGTLVFRELVPTVPGDATGISPFYLILACVIPAYFVVVGMQRAVGFGLRAQLATFLGCGAVTAGASYLVAAYGWHVIPQHPLDLLYLFLLTQAVALPSYGLVPFLGVFVPALAIPLFILLSVPTSGGAVPVELVPGIFRSIHPILPMGNAIDALRSIGYFGNSQLFRPTWVLCAWILAGAILILIGYLAQERRRAQEEAEQPMTGPVPESSEAAPVNQDFILNAPPPAATADTYADEQQPGAS